MQKQIDERRSEIKRDVNAERIAASAPVDEISDREIASLYAELNSARTRRTGDWASQKGDMVAASDAANAARAAAVKAAKAVLRSAREAQGIDVEAEEKAAAEAAAAEAAAAAVAAEEAAAAAAAKRGKKSRKKNKSSLVEPPQTMRHCRRKRLLSSRLLCLA